MPRLLKLDRLLSFNSVMSFHAPLARSPSSSVQDLFRSLLLGSQKPDEFEVTRGQYRNLEEYSTSARPLHQNAVWVTHVRYHRKSRRDNTKKTQKEQATLKRGYVMMVKDTSSDRYCGGAIASLVQFDYSG